MTEKKPKTLIIGWDAADWKVINALIEEDKMPHTAALIERGVMGSLATLHPVLSPMLWTSIATGKRPYKHGILGFTEPTPDGGSLQPISQLSRSTKTLWNILNQEGYRGHVIGWWPSHPVEPINGVMVSNHYHTAVGPPEKPWPLAPGMVHPKRVQNALAEVRLNPNELIVEQILPFIPKAMEIDQDKDRRLGSVMKILAECASVQAAATWAMANEPWDYSMIYFDTIDHFCHGFMKYHPPRRPHISEHDYELYKGVVEAGYRFHDMMLGAMLAMVPDDTTVVICSDHGFHPDHLRPVQLPNEPAGPAIEHRDLGMFIMAGPGIKKDHLVHGATLLDITPTVLTSLGLPVGDDMDGKSLLDAFATPPEIASIPSWDEVPGDDARLSSEQYYDPLAAKEAMDQLVALGYIEAPGENREKAISNTVRELRYNLARAYMDGDRYGDAAPILEELYTNEPEEYRFGVQLALVYRALNRVADLRPLVENLSQERRDAAIKARQDLTELTEKLTEQQRAEKKIKEGAKFDHTHLSEHEAKKYRDLQLLSRFDRFDLDYLMAWVLSAEGDHQAALTHLKRAEKAEPHRPGLHVQIGEAYLAQRQWSEALQAFNKVLKIDTLNPHGHLGRARALLRQRQDPEAHAEALAEARQAVSLMHHYPMAHYILGTCLLRQKQYFLAADAMQVAISLNPNFEQAHRYLALYHSRLGKKELAYKHMLMVRESRRLRKMKVASDILANTKAGSDVLLPEDPKETQQTEFDGAPEPLVDKSRVPAHAADCITVVAGLPRTGTSMMMQMLAAGGINPLSDDKRSANDDNPKGYYELEKATSLRRDNSWLDEATGQVVKVVAQLLPFLPGKHTYRIVFMERDLKEVLRSQQLMLKNLGREPAKLSDQQLQKAYQQQLKKIKIWLAKQPNLRAHFVAHRDVLEQPEEIAQQLNRFLGSHLNEEAMAAAVDPSLYRQKTS